ncbi:shikimate kinase [Hordeum vulgare]|nr:shikimate kinase [Hordeum vulgare]
MVAEGVVDFGEVSGHKWVRENQWSARSSTVRLDGAEGHRSELGVEEQRSDAHYQSCGRRCSQLYYRAPKVDLERGKVNGEAREHRGVASVSKRRCPWSEVVVGNIPASHVELAMALAFEARMKFTDTTGEVELRLDIGKLGIESSRDVFVDVDDTSLLIRAKSDGTLRTLMNVGTLFDRVKSSETIWFIDEDQLVVNLKKVEQELKWPDIDESWKSLTAGITQLLTGISIHIVGDSTDINEAVAKEIAEGIGYLPVCTSELLESATQKSVDTWVAAEGVDSVAEAECVVLESLSSHVRTVVATLGGKQGAASRFDKWQYLHSGFTVWLSVSEAGDEASAKEEARRSVSTGSVAYAKADVVVKLGGWDPEYTQAVAQGCLVALKQLTLADKKLAGKKSLYIRLGCRGDWPNIEPPGWDPQSDAPPTNI